MNDAFDLMLGVWRAPSRAALLCGRALPSQIIEVMRVAAGDAEASADAHDSTGLDASELNEAAVLLLHHLLFFDGADHYRVLGVDADDDDEQIKRHYRALMRWLHPDRDPENLHSVFAERVNRAWNALRTPQRRASYDASRHDETDDAYDGFVPDAGAAAALSVPRWQADGAPWLSGRMVRRLPELVAATGACIAIALLALVVWLRHNEPQRTTAAIVPAPVSASPLPSPSPARAREEPRTEVSTTAAAPPATLFAASATTFGGTDAPPATTGASATPVIAATVEPIPGAARTEAPKATAARANPPAARRVATAPPLPKPLSEDEVVAFVAHFEQLYAGNDVDAFLALFGDDAIGNGSDGLRELSIDYRRLFSTSAHRQLRLREMRWQIDAGRAVGHGRYDASVDASAQRKDSQGQILLALRRDGDALRITRLNHSVGH
jgi:hypothetical protein